jgi:hypothetical protein
MLRLFAGLVAAALLLMAGPSVAETPRTHEEMKKAVSVKKFADGKVIASSAPFAVTERSSRYVNGGKQTNTVSVMIEAWPDKPVEIYFLASSNWAVFQTEVQSRDDPAKPEEPRVGYVGPPWTKTTARVLENSVTCESDAKWCRQQRHRRIDLTQDMVREIVGDAKRTSISMSLDSAHSDFKIPRSHLIATLDAIGLLHAFD